MHEQAMIEWEAWKTLVALLVECKAVTEADCKARVSDDDTTGLRLFQAIKAWGKEYAKLVVERPDVLMNP